MRMSSRGNFIKLYNCLRFDVNIVCDNRSCCNSEEALLMLLYFMAYPMRLSSMQTLFGREYSQISRIIRAVFLHIDSIFSGLVTNSLKYFVNSFPYYNEKFKRKFCSKNNVNEVPVRFRNVACVVDGTKVFTTKNLEVNFNGWKHRYCLSSLLTTFCN